MPTTIDYSGRPQITGMKPVCTFLTASPVGKQIGEVSCLLGWQGGEEKMAALLSQWPAVNQVFLRSGQLFCPCGPPQNQFFSSPPGKGCL
jgi:hypothetical protein